MPAVRIQWLTYLPPIAIVGISLYIRCCLHSNYLKERPQRLWHSYRLASNVPQHQSHYDTFVRWQMNKLYKLDEIKLGGNIDRWKGWWPQSLFSRRYSTSRDNVQFQQLPSSMRTGFFPLGMGRLTACGDWYQVWCFCSQGSVRVNSACRS